MANQDSDADRPVLRCVRHTVESRTATEGWRRATWMVEFELPAGTLPRARALCEALEACVRTHTREDSAAREPAQ